MSIAPRLCTPRHPPRRDVLVLRSEVLSAVRERGGVGVLFGTREIEGGVTILRVESDAPAPGLCRLGVAAPERQTSLPGEVWLSLSEDLEAFMGDTPLDVIVSDPTRYRDRVSALPGAAAVEGKTALLVGLGSVGSDIGARLVRIGVRVIGCDPDRLRVENMIRWGLLASVERDVGRFKSDAWASALRSSVPNARIEGIALDVVQRGVDFDALVEREHPDLLIAATDTRDSRRVVNAAAAMHHIPALFVALSDGAASARIEVVEDAARGPCHGCSVIAEGGSAPADGRRSSMPYASEPAPETQAVPALPVDVAIGAAIATRVALLLLAGAGSSHLLSAR